MNNTIKNILLWLFIIITVVVLYGLYNSHQKGPVKELDYTKFQEKVSAKAIQEATIKGAMVEGRLGNGDRFTAAVPENSQAQVADALVKAGANVHVVPAEKDSWLTWALSIWLPLILFVGFWVFLMRQMQGTGNKAISFGKSRAKLLTSQQKKVTFKDVAGVDEAIEELTEVVEFLKEPQKFQKLGGRIPKGVLLVGAPGTGKTLLARAVAGEANVPFFSISGSDFVEMFVGVGASRVRDLFDQGKKHAPCIIFIDEIDAVGRHRGAGLGGGHDEREQTLNQLLVEMDGFESNEGVILIAATNRPDVLDPALLRPGRFDRQVVVNLPDVRGRLGILRVHTRKIPISPDVDLEIIARSTPGFSGAQLANLVNEAALNAARYSRKSVMMGDFEMAKDKVLMGKERRSLIINEQEKKITAYHEAGHALLAALLPDADPIHKVAIIPRGMALGITQQLPVDDRYNYSRNYLLAQLKVLMGGRIAEEVFLKIKTTGAANDIERATEMARKMVCEWGMSDQLGPLAFGKKEEQIFLGREIAQHRDYSEQTAELIDQEVQQLVRASYTEATGLVEQHREAMERIAQALLEFEVLDAEEVEMAIRGETIVKHKERTAPKPTDSKPTDTKQEEEVVPGIITTKEGPAPA
ncbi:MAG TPA: ATP-dependent zinc metalloprotease FtsH [Acidobacteriota bacterium]|nr:ATP-dependent zinc metalloprotease FtsH [Acidobacteriota bacterium]HQM62512.1 ATP-dependent zinc metalloprotease FtsH [Acidobacteriota bacterium]